MLAQLERKDLLSNASEIENLGLIMALFMSAARNLREEHGQLEDTEEEPLGPEGDNRTWKPHAFDNHILAYACKYDIDLVGDTNLDETIAAANAYVKLPRPESISDSKADPFGFAVALERYDNVHGGIGATMAVNFPLPPARPPTRVGGDNLDMTTWSTMKRRVATRHLRDPLSEEQVDALKKGMVLSFFEDVPEWGWYARIRVLVMKDGKVVSDVFQDDQI